jgi:hypothetical protein
MSVGQLAINLNTASPGLFFKDSAGALIKVGPVHVGTTAPNASPAGGGETGNTVGEQWLDTAGGTYVFKVWDGSAWRSESGTFVDVNGDVMTGALGIIAGSAGSPGLYFSGDTNTGLYSPGADQVAISTNGTGRLFVDASGNISLGQASSALQSGGTGLTIYGASASEIKLLSSTTGSANTDGTALVVTSSDFTINNREAGNVIFGTSNTERMRLDSSGRLGLGTSSPSAPLHIEVAGSGTADTDAVFIKNASSSYGRALLQFRSNNNYGRVSLYGGSPGTAAGYGTFDLHVNDNSLSNNRFIHIEGDSYNNYLAFWTGSAAIGTNAERMRIDSSGRVGIGTTSPEARLTTISTATLNGVTNCTFRSSDNATSSFYIGHGSGGISNLVSDSALGFGFNSGGTYLERARIDSSGRLLVGTSSSRSVGVGSPYPSRLQVETTSYAGLSLVNNSNDAIGCVLAIGKSRGTAAGGVTSVNNGDEIGVIRFAAADGTDLESVGAQISAEIDAAPSGNDVPSRLVFSVTRDGSASPTEALRIDNAGRIDTFANETGLLVWSAAAAGTIHNLLGGINSASGPKGSGALCFRVYTNGNVENTNNSYGAISDVKLKENIVDAGSQWSDIKALQVRNYNLKEGQTHRQIGLIAQEVEPISPGLVYESPDRDAEGSDLGTVTKSVNYSVLYMKAVKALQEAMERIETLEAKVAALESA